MLRRADRPAGSVETKTAGGGPRSTPPTIAKRDAIFSRPGYLSYCFTVRGLILKHMLNQSAELDRLFHALADPARRAMVERLSRGPAPVSELARPLPMSLPAAMQHLACWRRPASCARRRSAGCAPAPSSPQALSQAEQWINARRIEWEHRLDRLGDYLKTLENEGDDDGSGH